MFIRLGTAGTAPPITDFHLISTTFDSSVPAADQATVLQAVQIVEDLICAPNTGLQLSVTSVPLPGVTDDGPGGALAAAGPNSYHGNGTPAASTIFLDPDDTPTVAVVLHELWHALGMVFDGTNVYSSLVDTGGAVFTGVGATAAWQSAGGAGFPPLQPSPDLSHWSEAVFLEELLTPILNADSFVSEMSLRLLSDIGYDIKDFSPFGFTAQAIAAAVARTEGCVWCVGGTGLVRHPPV